MGRGTVLPVSAGKVWRLRIITSWVVYGHLPWYVHVLYLCAYVLLLVERLPRKSLVRTRPIIYLKIRFTINGFCFCAILVICALEIMQVLLIPCYEKVGLARDRAQAQAKSGVAQVGFPFRFGMVKPISEVHVGA
jgi:hypothetical protein